MFPPFTFSLHSVFIIYWSCGIILLVLSSAYSTPYQLSWAWAILMLYAMPAILSIYSMPWLRGHPIRLKAIRPKFNGLKASKNNAVWRYECLWILLQWPVRVRGWVMYGFSDILTLFFMFLWTYGSISIRPYSCRRKGVWPLVTAFFLLKIFSFFIYIFTSRQKSDHPNKL